jgi:XTP/dITP diphosphohydrolase
LKYEAERPEVKELACDQGTKRMKLIVATKNKGKLEEIAQILAQFPYDVVSMAQAGVKDDIEETGSSFEENALIKAMSVWRITGETVLADDSGLEVDYLGGAPGVHSARYAGPRATDEDKNNKLLDALSGVPADKRTARFVCAIAVVFPDGRSVMARGTCEGIIAFDSKGDYGFGYDPLFYIPEHGLTLAQMDSDIKNKLSHRGKALRELVEILEHEWRNRVET